MKLKVVLDTWNILPRYWRTFVRGSFSGFWMGRRILAAYRKSYRRGERRICFLKITPDPTITTYMVGYSISQLRKRMESGAAKVLIPPEYRPLAPPSRSDVATPTPSSP